MNSKDKDKRTNESSVKPVKETKVLNPYGEKYSKNRREYEKMMQHDAHRRVRGTIRQTRWGYRD